MSGPILPCQGGWCNERERCQHYYAKQVHGHKPHDRICRGRDDTPLLFDKRPSLANAPMFVYHLDKPQAKELTP